MVTILTNYEMTESPMKHTKYPNNWSTGSEKDFEGFYHK